MSTRLVELEADVAVYAPGAPGPIIRKELRKAAQRFCRATLAAQVVADPFTVAADTETLDLLDYCPTQTIPVMALDLRLDDRVIVSSGIDNLLAAGYAFTKAPPSLTANQYGFNERILHLTPVPKTAVTAYLRLAVCPSDNASVIPDDLSTMWREAIVGGALERVCSVPNTAYQNPQFVVMGASWYQKGLRDARIAVQNSYGRGTRVNMRPFA